MYDIDIMQEVHAASHIKGNVLALHVPRQLPWLPRHSVLVVHIQRRPQVTTFTELCNPSNNSSLWCLCKRQMTHGVRRNGRAEGWGRGTSTSGGR